jgi:hypothetical protein
MGFVALCLWVLPRLHRVCGLVAPCLWVLLRLHHISDCFHIFVDLVKVFARFGSVWFGLISLSGLVRLSWLIAVDGVLTLAWGCSFAVLRSPLFSQAHIQHCVCSDHASQSACCLRAQHFPDQHWRKEAGGGGAAAAVFVCSPGESATYSIGLSSVSLRVKG